jgi:hypothetical protein
MAFAAHQPARLQFGRGNGGSLAPQCRDCSGSLCWVPGYFREFLLAKYPDETFDRPFPGALPNLARPGLVRQNQADFI